MDTKYINLQHIDVLNYDFKMTDRALDRFLIYISGRLIKLKRINRE